VDLSFKYLACIMLKETLLSYMYDTGQGKKYNDPICRLNILKW